METVSTLFPLLAPLALWCVALTALTQPGSRPRRVLRTASIASGIGGVVAAATGLRVILLGPATSPLLGVGGVGFALRLDAILFQRLFCSGLSRFI